MEIDEQLHLIFINLSYVFIQTLFIDFARNNKLR
jgi:hypothetical protein